MGFISGHFTATMKAVGGSHVDIGDTKEGFTRVDTLHNEPIQTDAGGRTMRDGVQMGGDCVIRLDYVDYDLIEKYFYDQVTATPGTQQLIFKPMLNVGKLLTALAAELKLSPVAGTPAETLVGVGKSIYFYRVLCESDVPSLLAAGLRTGPLTLRCLPAPDSDSTNKGKVWEVKT